jgi:hypothetical protein
VCHAPFSLEQLEAQARQPQLVRILEDVGRAQLLGRQLLELFQRVQREGLMDRAGGMARQSQH